MWGSSPQGEDLEELSSTFGGLKSAWGSSPQGENLEGLSVILSHILSSPRSEPWGSIYSLFTKGKVDKGYIAFHPIHCAQTCGSTNPEKGTVVLNTRAVVLVNTN